MLDALNDDCQLAIIKYLNLFDRIALYEATKGTSNRLNKNIAYAWKLQLSFVLDWNNYKKFEEMPELLDVFLSNCSATMQELKLLRVKLDFLKRWENYTFPRMKTLEYTLETGDQAADEAIRTLKWTQMRKLDLSESWHYYDYDWAKDIAKCQLLEELTLDDCTIGSNNYDDLMAMPKLHKLCIVSAFDVKLVKLF
ncbi:uncharacterized protein LOC117565769 isoform X2 [Drosophila albomicans]|uniref:Uncharacterized protein LOC117565769 isoform X2 n=1 Tax=Drosophila albomicans TaxID=7291 RepID=A0A9C6WDL3_DROAB|nr:uncharacterized protein LOC117565769 isoform X2 [Drosophila albomicans]